MKTPNIDDFKAWAKSHKRDALAVVSAQAFALAERERVDAYVEPIFKSFNFQYSGEMAERCGLSGPIPYSKELYLCDDEPAVKEYYAACARAHREHGWKGDAEFCPALVAEHDRIKAEQAFLKLGCEVFGLDDLPSKMEHRAEMLRILLGACMIGVSKVEAMIYARGVKHAGR